MLTVALPSATTLPVAIAVTVAVTVTITVSGVVALTVAVSGMLALTVPVPVAVVVVPVPTAGVLVVPHIAVGVPIITHTTVSLLLLVVPIAVAQKKEGEMQHSTGKEERKKRDSPSLLGVLLEVSVAVAGGWLAVLLPRPAVLMPRGTPALAPLPVVAAR